MAIDFGKDVSCTTSLRPGRLVSGVRLVAEAAYRRITTPRGMLRGGEEEAEYGLDLMGLIGAVATKSEAAALEARIRNELTKDERIVALTVTVAETRDGPGSTFEITIDAETDAGPFDLVLAASAVTVELLRLTTGES